MKDPTKCANGHEWTARTTYFYQFKKGPMIGKYSKRCKVCRAESQRRQRTHRERFPNYAGV